MAFDFVHGSRFGHSVLCKFGGTFCHCKTNICTKDSFSCGSCKGVIKMMVNNLLACDFFGAISLLVAFLLQSQNDEILWYHLNPNT